jgi:guanylate kinase
MNSVIISLLKLRIKSYFIINYLSLQTKKMINPSNVLVVSGPSGVGKGTLIKKL